MSNLAIVTNLELKLTPGVAVYFSQPDEFDEIALIECRKNRTEITLLENAENLDSKAIRALKDEKIPTFSIDNEILSSIINRSSAMIEDLIALLAYHQNINQNVVDVLMEKIYNLSNVYAPEYIISEIRKLSERDFEAFLETDDTFSWFKANI